MRMPNGNLVAGQGGYIQAWAWKYGSNYVPTPTNFHYLDVAYWHFERRRLTALNWYSGSCGAMRRRLVAEDWALRARVWWDYRRPPELVLTPGDSLSVKLTIGHEGAWNAQTVNRNPNLVDWAPASPEAIINQFPAVASPDGLGLHDKDESPLIPFYIAPLAELSINAVTDDSQGDDIVYADIEVLGDSLLWFIWNQQTISDYWTYVSKLQDQFRKFIPLQAT
jgi:hypothetical protein